MNKINMKTISDKLGISTGASSDTDYFLEESDVESKNDQKQSIYQKIGKSGHNYECNYENCKQVFIRRDNYDSHMFQHTNIRTYPCTKEGCSKTYVNTTHLKRHLKSHESVKCKGKTCKLEFEAEEEMLKHYDEAHVKTFTCTICSEVFKRKQLFNYHNYKHTKEYPYKCDEENCDKKFILRAQLIRHKTSHNKHSCKICKEEPIFKTWTDFLAHQKISHPRNPNYKCNECNNIFRSKNKLLEHKKIHISKTERMVYPCTYEKCPKFYFTEQNLKTHVKAKHENLYKFVCTHDGCGRELSSKQKLDGHLKLHFASSLRIVRKKVHTKTVKAKRKDLGQKKVSTASIVAGVNLPLDVEKMVLSGLNQDIEIHNSAPELISSDATIDSEVESVKRKTKSQVELTVVGAVANLCDTIAEETNMLKVEEIKVK